MKLFLLLMALISFSSSVFDCCNDQDFVLASYLSDDCHEASNPITDADGCESCSFSCQAACQPRLLSSSKIVNFIPVAFAYELLDVSVYFSSLSLSPLIRPPIFS